MAAKWTIMVFLNGDNNLEPFALKDFREMAQVGSTDQVNIIVQMDRNGKFAVTVPQWNGTLRYRVERGMLPTPNAAIEDIGEINMGDGRALADFVHWSLENFPAERNMLIIWDHGQGWRFAESFAVRGTSEELKIHRDFRRVNSIVDNQRRSKSLENINNGARPFYIKEIPAIPDNQVINSPVRYVSSDDTSNDHLFNREIQDVLQNLLQENRIDIIGFDACLMGMVETCYAMRKVAHFMVASEELEPGDGWNYADWLGRLINDPDMNGQQLGHAIVESYKSSYEFNDPATTLACINLSNIEDLTSAIDLLADRLSTNLQNHLNEIIAARGNCQEYAPGYGLHGIDLLNFCLILNNSVGDQTIKQLSQAVINKVQQCIINNYAGVDRQGNFGSHGLAIYFPKSRALFNTDPDGSGYRETNTVFPVEFVQSHRWDNFLKTYYNLVP